MAGDVVTQVVLDNGSDMCKTEFACDNASRAVIRSSVDKPKVPGIMVGIEQKDSNVGDVQSKRGVSTSGGPKCQASRLAWTRKTFVSMRRRMS